MAAAASCRVAVVGAGAAGLAAARELAREGHAPVVFEQGREAAGVWVYSPAADADPLGSDAASGRRAHGSLYAGLRTNLPREIMSFTEYPFTPGAMAAAGQPSGDGRRFPGHGEVLAYLRAYAEHYGLHKFVRYGARVVRAKPLGRAGGGAAAAAAAAEAAAEAEAAEAEAPGDAPVTGDSGPRWEVTFEVEDPATGARDTQRQEFDALVVCNGHYTATNLPRVEGREEFPGLQMHSHNYRTPEPFAGQTVLIVGASNSGEDLCREIATAAARVILCARSWKNTAWADDGGAPFGPRANIERRGMVLRLRRDGGAEFEAGAAVGGVDAVVYATGYRYEFPFLDDSTVEPDGGGGGGGDGGGGDGEGEGVGTRAGGEGAAGRGGAAAAARLSLRDQHVWPLWQHMFFPPLAPTLAFIGLPWKWCPFSQFELQSRLVARTLSGRAPPLPSRARMAAEVDAASRRLAALGRPPRWFHMLGDDQWAYADWLLDAAGSEGPRCAPWRAAMYKHTGESKRAHPEDYRDRWGDAAAAAEAAGELAGWEAAVLREAAARGGSGAAAAAAAAH
ncbi:hypothetical protein Rsub_03664 [Raphidocelis subcapitata]|uniref:Flavin-containing monooxygenase n=1 Tax=Raphidocelis subcapitata TaxID=307507 RepID=A0A2V0NUM5_9CHLO|nr:hypothetical protein Rsub_03664 [Raphidocelis subcapitata]|eukprot:GBF91344.1 hypothetical protein Rsub_03664 [Raphidocelis subcapitata]